MPYCFEHPIMAIGMRSIDSVLLRLVFSGLYGWFVCLVVYLSWHTWSASLFKVVWF